MNKKNEKLLISPLSIFDKGEEIPQTMEHSEVLTQPPTLPR